MGFADDFSSPHAERRIGVRLRNQATNRGMIFDTDFNRWRVDTGEQLAFSNCLECKRRANVEALMRVVSHQTGEVKEVFPVRCRSYKCKHVSFMESYPPQFDQELVPKKQKEPVNV